MGQNHFDARSAWRSVWALFADTFTHRSTPLTVLDLLRPAPAAGQFDLRGVYPRLRPALPHPSRPPDGSDVVRCATRGGSAWTGER
jgi:hypothetical protein